MSKTKCKRLGQPRNSKLLWLPYFCSSSCIFVKAFSGVHFLKKLFLLNKLPQYFPWPPCRGKLPTCWWPCQQYCLLIASPVSPAFYSHLGFASLFINSCTPLYLPNWLLVALAYLFTYVACNIAVKWGIMCVSWIKNNLYNIFVWLTTESSI